MDHGIGQRIRAARLRDTARPVTQDALAEHMKMSRSGIAGWESGTNSPTFAKLARVAGYLGVEARWLAFGDEARSQDMVFIPEVRWNAGPGEPETVSQWAVPRDWLRGEVRATSQDRTVIWRMRDTTMAPLYLANDRLMIDRAVAGAAGDGLYLIWNGIGAAISRVTGIVAHAGSKPMVALSVSDPLIPGREIAAESLHVLGRVRGLFRAG